MPNWICKKCNHEFWGWAVYYRYKTGEKLLCPDCAGSLIQKHELEKQEGIISRLLNGESQCDCGRH